MIPALLSVVFGACCIFPICFELAIRLPLLLIYTFSVLLPIKKKKKTSIFDLRILQILLLHRLHIVTLLRKEYLFNVR